MSTKREYGERGPDTALQILHCYTDGACRGNPGPSAYAYILLDGEGGIIRQDSGYLGEGTNNSAEYHAVIESLKAAARYTRGRIVVFSDSELVVRQINGTYRIRKDHLADLCGKVRKATSHFEGVEFKNVPRDHPVIARADLLCNRVLDMHAGKKG